MVSGATTSSKSRSIKSKAKIRSESNEIVGSVGVSGASGAEDEYIGLRAVQLSSIRSDVITEPKEHMCLTVMDGLSS